MYSLTISNNRMLMRLNIIFICFVLIFSSSVTSLASETGLDVEADIVDNNPVSVEEPVVEEGDSKTEVTVDEIVTNDDNLQTDEVSEEDSVSDETLNNIYDVLTFILGIMIFFVVVLLCKYSYKFFNIFF